MILAYLFFEERLLGDAGADILPVINLEAFNIIHNRWILIFAQTIPLIAIKLGASLKTVLIAYSLGHILFYYLIFLIILHGFRDRYGGFGIILLQLLGASYMFLSCPMFELHYASALLLLFHSMVRNTTHKAIIFYLSTAILFFFIITGYPTAAIGLGFVLLYNRKILGRHLAILIPIAAFIWVYSIFQLDPYETDILNQSHFKFSDLFATSFNLLKEVLQVIPFMLEAMTGTILLFLLLVVFYLLRKEIRSAVLLVGFGLAYVMAVIFIYGFDNVYEHRLDLLVILVIIPFLYDFLPLSKQQVRSFGYVLLFLILIPETIEIILGCIRHSARVDLIKRLADHKENSSEHFFLLDHENMTHNRRLGSSTFFQESILISAAYNKNKNIAVYAKNDGAIAGSDSIFYSGYEFLRTLNAEVELDFSFNPKYFNLGDVQFAYLNSVGKTDSEYIQQNIRIEILQPPKRLNNSRRKKLTIQILNDGEEKLHSHLDQHVYIAYYWLLDGDTISTSTGLLPLEIDVVENYIQPLHIKTPELAGNYYLMVDLVRDRETDKYDFTMKDPLWLSVGQKVPIEIH